MDAYVLITIEGEKGTHFQCIKLLMSHGFLHVIKSYLIYHLNILYIVDALMLLNSKA